MTPRPPRKNGAPEVRPWRRRSLFFWALALAPAGLAAAWGPWIPAFHAGLRWEGRVRFAPDQSAVYDWASVRLHASVETGALAVYARVGRNYLDVLVDGKRVAVLGPKPAVEDAAWAGIGVRSVASGGAPIFRVEGLGPGRHEIVIAKRTGPNFGPVTLLGLRLDAEGKLFTPPPAPQRRLEFIGDSLSNAYGVEGPGKQCKDLGPYENSSLSWARLCADQLGADLQLLAFSGYGLVRNYGAAGPRSDDPVPFYYPRTVLAESDGVWARRDFVPNLSVVFLGTNDYSTAPHPGAAEFDDAYAAFLGEVRKGRDGLKILVAYPDDHSELSKRVQAVIGAEQMVGHWVEGLALPPAADAELGCDWHPKAAVQKRWAALAAEAIGKMLQWQ